MRPLQSSEVLTLGLLSAVATVTFMLPETITVPTLVADGATPPTVRLTGIVRDFTGSHADFAVTPAEGTGHYAGNVALTLDGDGRPVFAAGDENGPLDNRIAQWKLDDGAGTTTSDEMGLNPGTLINGATWTTGHDGGALHFDGVDDYVNVPNSPEMQIAGDITFTGWFKLDEDFNTSSPTTMLIMEKFYDTSHDFHIALTGNDYSGSLAHGSGLPFGRMIFKVETIHSGVHGARYVWTSQDEWLADTWYHFAAVLSSSDPSTNRIIVNGVDDTADTWGIGGFIDTNYDAPLRFGGRTFDNGYAADVYFKGTLDNIMIFDRALVEEDYGSPEGFQVAAQWTDSAANPIAPHTHTTGENDACANPISDVAGTEGVNSDGGITDSNTFDEWFRDVPGVNMSGVHAITLTRNGAGVWSYLDDDFRPIDGRLLGDGGDSHNNHFTYHIGADFEYNQCGAQFVEFEGGDGAWLFINGELVIDLGGVDTAERQYVALDRLGLTDGQTYRLDLFYAERDAGSSVFRLRTTLDLARKVAPHTVSAAFD